MLSCTTQYNHCAGFRFLLKKIFHFIFFVAIGHERMRCIRDQVLRQRKLVYFSDSIYIDF